METVAADCNGQDRRQLEANNGKFGGGDPCPLEVSDVELIYFVL